MKSEQPTPVHLAKYQPFGFEIKQTRLVFVLDEDATIVRAELDVVRKENTNDALVLDGIGLELLLLQINGQDVDPSLYQVDAKTLQIQQMPDQCTLRIETRFSPKENLALSGLYMSGGRFCTQCEAEGFRHITYYPDRPDVMSKFSVRIEADRAFATLLSNGNLKDAGELPNGRHFAQWEDPFKKPAYLFALVAGSFDMIEDSFTTMSNKTVPLRVYVDPGDAKFAHYAMDALKRSMKWDEDVFGREYDLDLFMIVAVRSFNFGAMENKGLNIFNSSVLLADAQTATDTNFEFIESVVAHEYFHNWTGNRITCRDWFQLCLKEGLTVFRDQEFSADQRGRAICRIKDVKTLRARQFPEDASPLAHPVRPASYLSIDNFYTATVYEKGAELIRALKTILGDEMFAKGMDHYFETCDGTAATMEQFLDCFAHVSGQNLSQFLRWYGQAGTPIVTIDENWDEETGILSLRLGQSTHPTPGQDEKQPVPIPMRFGLLGKHGPLRFSAPKENIPDTEEAIFVLSENTQSISFAPLRERPVLSAFRQFSAPVYVKMQRSSADQAHLIAHDTDLFNRWEMAQQYGRAQLLAMTDQVLAGTPPRADPQYIHAISAILQNPSLDPAFIALAIQPPGEDEIFQAMENAAPEAIAAARSALLQQLAQPNLAKLQELQTDIRPQGAFDPDAVSAGKRALANQALLIMATLAGQEQQKRAWTAWQASDNMTDAMAALGALDRAGSAQFQSALDEFYQKWHKNPLVIDKWFAAQASAHQTTKIQDIQALLEHPDFDANNPNRVRAVYAAFTSANACLFHLENGDGYQLLADGILAIDPHNPSLAARLMGAFGSWRKVEPKRQKRAQQIIQTIRDTTGISANTFEIASKQLQ